MCSAFLLRLLGGAPYQTVRLWYEEEMNKSVIAGTIVEEELKEKDLPETSDHLEKLQQSGNLLLSIINNVLDMARIESGKMEIDENYGRIEDIRQTLFEIFGDEAKKKNLVLQYTINENEAKEQTAGTYGKNVIAIGRQFGSGGHDIGKALAEKLGYDFYDAEIIQMTAGTTGYPPEFVKKNEEIMTNSLLYDLVNQMYLNIDRQDEAPKDKIFEAECQVVRDLAKKGNCVMLRLLIIHLH